MSTRRLPSLSAGLQTLVRLYPWSALWVLFAIGLAMVVSGSVLAVSIVFILIFAVIAHSVYRDRHQRKE